MGGTGVTPQVSTSPKWVVAAPDGKVIQFPDSFQQSDVEREMNKLYPAPGAGTISGNVPTMRAAPATGTLPWLKSALYTAADKYSSLLPAAGSTAGAMIGAGAGSGVTPGLGTAAGAVGGAGIGGMAGSALQRLLRQTLGFDAPQAASDNANGIAKDGAIQGGIQAASESLPFLAPVLKNAAVGQYTRALAPTTKATKAITQDIVPGLIQRGVHGSLDALEDTAGSQADALRPALDQAYDAAEAKFAPVRNPIRALLPAAPTEIPLATPQAGNMPGGLLRAKRPQIPESAFSPEARIAAGDSGLSVIRNPNPPGPEAPYRYYSTSGDGEIPNAPQSEAGVMITRNPETANQFTKPQGSYPISKGGIPGAGKQVVNDLENLKNTYVVDGHVANQQAYDAVNNVQDIVRQYGNDISPKSLRQLKQIFDEPVAAANGYAGTDLATHYSLNAQQAAANSIRSILHQASPDIAALNKEVSFWLNVQKVVGDTAQRQTGQQGGLLKLLTPLAYGAAGAAGFAAHGVQTSAESVGATWAIAATSQAVRSPAWRTTSAIFKDRLASALATGDAGQVGALLGRLGVAAQGPSQVGEPSARESGYR